MKPAIHPAYNEIKVLCACGHSFATRSTHKGDLHVEICSSCHPFFTGKQKMLDTAGRVERFRRKYAKARSRQGRTRQEVATDLRGSSRIKIENEALALAGAFVLVATRWCH